MRWAAILLSGVWLSLIGPCNEILAQSRFANWAGVIVAGDDHAAHTSRLTEALDNARHDVTAALIARSFTSSNLAQFSVRPAHFQDALTLKSDAEAIGRTLKTLAAHAREGCMIYFSSHGGPAGIVVADRLMSPSVLADTVDQACGTRPTVIIISACFSGIFVPDLAKPNRLILTAARADRASFGCGESDGYPYFDACILSSMPAVGDFVALGPRVQDCIARREAREHLTPNSEPQVSLGADLNASMLAFAP